jgi:hypothetical protein
MQYEVKSAVAQGLPETRKINNVDTYGVPLIITTGIVGQTYDPTKKFVTVEANTETFCPILRTDGTDVAEAKFAVFAAAYVVAKYPNT